MNIVMALRIVAATVVLGLVVALFFTNRSLNSAKMERDVAVERANNNAKLHQMAQAELLHSNQQNRLLVEGHNKAVESLAEAAEASRRQNAAQIRALTEESALWRRSSAKLAPIPVGADAQQRLDNIDAFLSLHIAEVRDAR